MLATPCAIAQTVDPPDSLFMRPATEGDPLNPLNPLSPRDPRSLQNTRRRTPLQDTVSPLGQIPRYGVLPASGAGRSGFDSTNRGLPKAKAPLTPKQKAAAAAKAKAKARSDAAAAIAPPAPLPNSAAARLPQYQLRRGASTDIVDPATIDPSLLVTPVRRRPPPEEDPFAPTGIRVGSFNLRPAIEIGGGYHTNPGRAPAGRPSWYEAVAPGLPVHSH